MSSTQAPTTNHNPSIAQAHAGRFVDSTDSFSWSINAPSTKTSSCTCENAAHSEKHLVSITADYQSNQQYSVTAITNSGGTVVERYAYQAYGEPTILDASASVLSSSSISNRYTYTGREWDGTVGLYHFRARWLSGLTGRFLSRDPIGYEGSDWHLSEFVGSNSVTAVDPFGECGCKPRSTSDCCQDSQAPGEINAPGGPRVLYGRSFCCDGRMVECVFRHNLPYINVKAKHIIAGCIFGHERGHTRDAAPCPKNCPEISEITYPIDMNDDISECRAAISQLSCLKRGLDRCELDVRNPRNRPNPTPCNPQEVRTDMLRVAEMADTVVA